MAGHIHVKFTVNEAEALRHFVRRFIQYPHVDGFELLKGPIFRGFKKLDHAIAVGPRKATGRPFSTISCGS